MLFRSFFSALRCRSYHNSNNIITTEQTHLLLQNHANSNSLIKCKQIHANLIVSNAISNTFTSNILINYYARSRDLSHAHLLFNQTSHKNVVTWTSMISSCTRHGQFNTALQLFEEMLHSDQKPNQCTLAVAIRACTSSGSLQLGLQIHGLVLGYGFERDEFAGSSLVDMYFKVGACLDDASRVFFGLCYRDCVAWNVMIHGFSEVGNVGKVKRLVSEMRVVDGLQPNDFTFVSLLRCCCCLIEVEQVHGLILNCGTEFDPVVGSALVDSYGKCGDCDSSEKIVVSMEHKDSFAWSSMISCYWRNGRGREAIVLFRDMCREGQRPDQHALSSVLKACVENGEIEIGIQVHSQMIKNGYQRDQFVASVLSSLYAEFNEMDEAEKVFTRISSRDIVSWNAMIMGYAQKKGCVSSCIKIYKELRRTTNMKPDGATLVAALKCCSLNSDLVIGRQLHAETIKLGQSKETSVVNSVIHMYSECEAVEDACRAFNTLIEKDDISWSSIIGCHAQNGLELQALMLSKDMLSNGFLLSCYTLPPCITACSVLAAMDLGKQFHSFVVKLGFQNDIYVGCSVIDMYAKSGSMEDSIKAFNEQDNPAVGTFNALISGLAQHGRVDEAIREYNKMDEMDIIPNKITFLAVLSACSHAGLVEESVFFFELMYKNYDLEPEAEHYSCLVDVFGRAGKLEDAYRIMQMNVGDSAWRTLLSASRTHGNMVIGEKSAKKMLEHEIKDHAPYVLLSNLYSGEGRWKEAQEIRQRMAKVGVKKDPGSSWLIVRDRVHDFKVGDCSHPEMERISIHLNLLNQQMKSLVS
ncbi:hypothetical protein Sjap_009711 [Stephania japonica]|uniref:Pentatricopeptide repeat-containing protein n=1 Tax=Stephania japonica TaxID=461633 RepID=A0AAP0J821_9MAGN